MSYAYYVDKNGKVTKNKKKKKQTEFAYTVDSKGKITKNNTTEDIAPVKSKKKEKKDTWFKAGGFSDGVDGIGDFFGDLGETVVGTVGDVGVGLGKGLTRMGEGIGDALRYGVAGVADLTGNDNYAERLRKSAKENDTDDIWRKAEKKVDKNSVLGNKSDKVTEGLGQVAGIILTGGIASGLEAGSALTTAITTGATGISGMGSGISEAYQEGATDKEAYTYGTIAGTGEALTELLFGGLGKAVKATGLSKGISSADDMLAKKVSGMFNNQIAKNFAEYGIKAGAEGTEEVLSGIVSAFGKNVTYMKEEELRNILKDENLLEQFVVGSITSGIAQSGVVPGMKSGSLIEANKQGTDFITGLTTNEQKVVDKEFENRIVEAEKDGKTLDKKAKNKIYDEVLNDLDKGYISTDTIESALGDKTYEAYKSMEEKENALKKEIESLENTPENQFTVKQREKLTELREELAKIDKTQVKNQLSSEVSELAKVDRLSESYNEKTRRSQTFEADLSKYDTKQQEVIKRATESGILNNTNRTHEFVDMVAKISADKGVLFDFTNNQKLKESGFAVEGKTVNGYVKDGNIAVNIDSNKSLNTVVGHEITHVLEGTELYTELQEAVKNYATTKGDYDTRIKELTELYKDVKDADIEGEVTADLVGDYLFTDKDFVNNLSVEKPNIFKKIFNEIKYLYKMATAGSKEARQLEKVKRTFENAYKENISKNSDTKHSLSDSDNKNIKVEVNDFYGGETFATMSYTQDGKTVGTIEYSEYDGKPNVKMIEVEPEYRRKGIATKLLQELQKKYPDAEINYGMTTPDGSKLLETITYDVTDEAVVADKQKLQNLQTELNELQERLDVLYDMEHPTAEQDTELRNLGDRWNEVYDNIRELESTLKGKKATKTFVKTDAKYSLSDSDGKELTKEQQEYFKDSKVRDENGNLKVMYHGSQNAGFHEFSNRFSDDGRSFFFTDNPIVAKGYSGTYENYEAKTLHTVEDVNNFFKEINEDDSYEVAEENGEFILYEDGDEIARSDSAKGIYDEFCDWTGLGYGSANYKVYLDLKNPLIVEGDMNYWDELPSIDDRETMTTRDYSEYAEENGYDGVIFKNIFDIALYATGKERFESSTVAIAFNPNQIKSVANNKPTIDDDIRFSLSEPVVDKNYLNAVKYGDTKTTQKMVDEVAKKNGYTKKMFHQTDAKNIHIFDTSLGTHGATDSETPYGIFTKSNDSNIGLGSIQMALYVKANNTLYVENRAEVKSKIPELIPYYDELARIDKEYDSLAEEAGDAELEALSEWMEENPDVNMDTVYPNQYIIDNKPADIDSQKYLDAFAERRRIMEEWNKKYNEVAVKCKELMTTYLRDNGYDSMYFKVDEGSRGRKTDSLIVLDSNQVKSADAVTYDDKGQVIPLSKRFNEGNNDIRYSLSEDEKNAHVKTAQEYFGTTQNWDEVGYITLDGNKLDFPGRHEGGPGGSRDVDHRDIRDALGEDYGGEDFSGSLVQFMREGNIRIMPESNGINLSAMPTKEQMQALDDFISRNNGEVILDIDDLNGKTVFSKEYPSGTFAEKIFKDIETHLKPNGDNYISPYSQFRQSLSNQKQNIAPYGNYNVYGKDIALEQAPVQEVAPLQKTIAPVQQNNQDIDYAPLTEEQANERDAEQSITSNESEEFEKVVQRYMDDAPAYMFDEDEIRDWAEEQARQNPQGATPKENTVIPESPLEERDIDEVGDRKIKAYMYENPEVKSFFQEEAQKMLWELQNTTRGERGKQGSRYGIDDYGIASDEGWYGTKRHTSKEIAYLRDDLKLKYDQIEKGLKAIIEDNGAENNAISKRIEFKLDERLREGYTDFMYGQKIPPNQDYINLLNEKKITEYNDEAFSNWVQTLKDEDISPAQEDIAPVEESIEQVLYSLEENKNKELSEIDTKVEEVENAEEPELSVNESYNAKLENYNNAIEGYKNARTEIETVFDEAIQKKTTEYENLKRKDTKKATDLLMQIENLKLRKANNLSNIDSRIEKSQIRVDNMIKNKDSIKQSMYRIRRRDLHTNIIDNMKHTFSKKGFEFDEVLKNAKNKSTIASNDNTPQRYMEKTLGYKEGQILADLTVNQVAQNESDATKWVNENVSLLKQISKEYGIKPRSKESAIAQMYAEGFYANEEGKLVKYGDKELEADIKDAKVRENIKKLSKDTRIREIYDNTLDMINESRIRNAYPEIPKRDNYFMHFIEMDDAFSRLGIPFNPNDIKSKDLPTDLNGMTADLKPGQPFFASSMQRKGYETTYDLIGGVEKYLNSAKNQIYHIDDIQALRATRNYIADMYGQAHGFENLDNMTEEEISDKIQQIKGSHLSSFARFLNEEANVIAGKTALIDRGFEGLFGRKSLTFVDTVNRQVGSNMIGFNVSSSLTNFLSVMQSMAKSSKADAFKAFTQTVSNKISSTFGGKTDGFADVNPGIIRRKGIDKFTKTPFEKITEPGYVLMTAIDDISTEIIVRTKFNELTRKGMSEEQAHIESDKWAHRILGDRSLGQQPLYYNSKALGLITKFQLEVRNQLDSQFYDTIQDAKISTEDIDNALARNAVKTAKVTSTLVQLAVLQHVFGKAFESVAGYNPAFDMIEVLMQTFGFDDDEDSEDTALDNVEQGFLALLEDMPYASVLTGGGRIPVSSALPIKEFVYGKDSYGRDKPRRETLKEALPYYLFPTGYGQFKKTKKGLEMFSDEHPVSGSYTDSGKLRFPVEDTPTNRLQAGLFGQYANENARYYFDNDIAPLNEKQTQEYIDVDMPIKDYWNYRDEIKGKNKIEDKADYISNMDIPIDKKNILINNASTRKDPIDMTDYDKYTNFDEFDFATQNPEKYKFLQENGISYKDYTENKESKKTYDWAYRNPKKYEFLQSIDVSYKEYSKNDDTKEAYTWAYNNQDKYVLSKAIANDVVTYKKYTKALSKIHADKYPNGKTISGSKKKKVLNYINGLDADYGEKLILFKSEYKLDDTYNYEIIDYLNNREDITYDEMNTVLKQLGFTVKSDGTIYW